MHLALATDNTAGGASMIAVLYDRWKQLHTRLCGDDQVFSEGEDEQVFHELTRVSNALACLQPAGKEDAWRLLEVARVEGELDEPNVQSRIVDGLLQWLRPEMGEIDLTQRPGQAPR